VEDQVTLLKPTKTYSNELFFLAQFRNSQNILRSVSSLPRRRLPSISSHLAISSPTILQRGEEQTRKQAASQVDASMSLSLRERGWGEG